jgi:hypothetical protein
MAAKIHQYLEEFQNYIYCHFYFYSVFFTIKKQKKKNARRRNCGESLNSFQNSQKSKKHAERPSNIGLIFINILGFCCFVELYVFQGSVAIPHQYQDPHGSESGKEGIGTPYPVLQALWRREAATRRWRPGRTADSQLCPAYRSRGCTPPPPHPNSPPTVKHFSRYQDVKS